MLLCYVLIIVIIRSFMYICFKKVLIALVESEEQLEISKWPYVAACMPSINSTLLIFLFDKIICTSRMRPKTRALMHTYTISYYMHIKYKSCCTWLCIWYDYLTPTLYPTPTLHTRRHHMQTHHYIIQNLYLIRLSSPPHTHTPHM